MCVLQTPIEKSKSCWPSRSTAAGRAAIVAASEFCCADPCNGSQSAPTPNTSTTKRICFSTLLRGSLRLVAFIFHPRLRIHPIHFPGLPAIRRKRLFVARRISGKRRKNKSHQDHSSVVRFLIVEFAASI